MPLYERRRVIRAFPYLLVAGLILYLGLIAGPMWLTRWRFRHLLADFNSVRATESTWADAQGLMRHWGRFGHYDGSCTAASCQYVIIVEDPLSVGIGKAGEETIDRLNRLHVFSLAERLGWRSARLYFSFTVRNGMILRTSSGFLLQVPAFANGQWDWPLSLGLATEIRDRLHRGDPVLHRHERPALGNDEQLADHPDWKVGRPDGCKPNCEEARIAYTPSLARSELVRLTSYDFSCLTRLHPCKELGDMLRAARDWHLYDPEYEVTNTTPMPPCDTDPRALGRDAEIVLEVQSLSVRKEQQQIQPRLAPITLELVQARLLSVLKGRFDTKVGSDFLITPYAGADGLPVADASEHLNPGQRYFVLLDSGRRLGDGQVEAPRCGVLAENAQVLRKLSEGIAEDVKYHDIDVAAD